MHKLAYPGLYIIFHREDQQGQTILVDYYTESKVKDLILVE